MSTFTQVKDLNTSSATELLTCLLLSEKFYLQLQSQFNV